VTEQVLLERVAHALERIADAIELAIAPPPPVADAPRCPHPVDARIEFGGMGQSADYQCRLCGERVESPKVNAHV
jgi:hypothetical protein